MSAVLLLFIVEVKKCQFEVAFIGTLFVKIS
jgi:hypothetical protein